MIRGPFLSGGGAVCCMRSATGERCTDLVFRGAPTCARPRLRPGPAPRTGRCGEALLGEDPVEICVPVAHPLAGRPVLTRQDLTGERWGHPCPTVTSAACGPYVLFWVMRVRCAVGVTGEMLTHV